MPCEAGDAIFFHGMTPHFSERNRSQSVRRAVAISCLSAKLRYTGFSMKTHGHEGPARPWNGCCCADGPGPAASDGRPDAGPPPEKSEPRNLQGRLSVLSNTKGCCLVNEGLRHIQLKETELNSERRAETITRRLCHNS